MRRISIMLRNIGICLQPKHSHTASVRGPPGASSRRVSPDTQHSSAPYPANAGPISPLARKGAYFCTMLSREDAATLQVVWVPWGPSTGRAAGSSHQSCQECLVPQDAGALQGGGEGHGSAQGRHVEPQPTLDTVSAQPGAPASGTVAHRESRWEPLSQDSSGVPNHTARGQSREPGSYSPRTWGGSASYP